MNIAGARSACIESFRGKAVTLATRGSFFSSVPPPSREGLLFPPFCLNFFFLIITNFNFYFAYMAVQVSTIWTGKKNRIYTHPLALRQREEGVCDNVSLSPLSPLRFF